jgi:hypothetical protein
MDTNNSAFYHFGILPAICIHTLDEDEYSKMYIVKEICECGCKEWIESTMKIVEDSMGYEFPAKRVHRCKNCNQVRLANHIGNKENES